MRPAGVSLLGLLKWTAVLGGVALLWLSQPDRVAAHNGRDPQCPLSGGNCPTGTLGDRWFGNHIFGAGTYDPLGVGIVPAKERYTAGETVMITFSFPFDFARYGGLGLTTTRLVVAVSTFEGRDTIELPCASFQPSPSAGQSLEEMPPAKLIKSPGVWNIDGYYAPSADGSRTTAFAGTCTDTVHPRVFPEPLIDAKDVVLTRQGNSYTGSVPFTIGDVDYNRGATGPTLSFQVIAIFGGPGGEAQWSPGYLGPFTVANRIDGPTQPFQLSLASQCVATGPTAGVRDSLTFSYRPSWPVGIHSPETARAAGASLTHNFAKMHAREYGMGFSAQYRLLVDGRLTNENTYLWSYGRTTTWTQVYVFLDIYLDPGLPGGSRWVSQLQRVIGSDGAVQPPNYPIELSYSYRPFQPPRTYQILVYQGWEPTRHLSNEVTSPLPPCGQPTITLAMSVRCDATVRGSDGRFVPRISATWGLAGTTLSRAELHWRASNLAYGANTDNSTAISPPTPGTFEFLVTSVMNFSRNIPFDFTILGFTAAGSWVRSPIVQLTIPDCPESQNPPIGILNPPACETDGRISLKGWARDPDLGAVPLRVALYRDSAQNLSNKLGEVTANELFPGSGNATIGDNFGFSWVIPANQNDGAFHLYFALALDPGNLQFTQIGATGTLCPLPGAATLDLKIFDPDPNINRYTDGPVTLTTSQLTTVRWTSENTAEPCHAVGSWSGEKPNQGTDPLGPLAAGPHTYLLVCSSRDNPLVTVQDQVTVTVTGTVLPKNPRVDLTIDDQQSPFDQPITVATNHIGILKWESQDVDTCAAIGFYDDTSVTYAGTWQGPKPVSGTEPTEALVRATHFVITCQTDGSTSAFDEVYVRVTAVSTPTPKVQVIGDVAAAQNIGGVTIDQSSIVAAGGLITIDGTPYQLPGYLSSGVLTWPTVKAAMLANLAHLRTEQARPLAQTTLVGTVNLNPRSGNPFDGSAAADPARPEGGVWLVNGNLELTTPLIVRNTGTLIVTGSIRLTGTGAVTVTGGTLGLAALGETDPAGIVIDRRIPALNGMAFFSAVGPLKIE